MSEYILGHFWLIPLLPLAGTTILGLLGLYGKWLNGRKPSKALVNLIAVGSVGLACLFSLIAIYQGFFITHPEKPYEQSVFTWISGSDLKTSDGSLVPFKVDWGYRLDPLSAVMLFVVTFVGFWIHFYSVGYMAEEPGYWRYFAYLNLFMFAMLTLVMANNFLLMFVGWEGVGLCSYLLIGYWYEKKSASDAGKKAFVVNRIGDAGFIIGMLLIFVTFGSLHFESVFSKAFDLPVETSAGVLTAITLFLFLGATGKSAQIPLYTWLPDAMEGPTPVSALIHAATMVTAGVYMVTRCNALYTRAPISLGIVTAIGIATAVFAATIGLVQRDIKRVLAYSTVSQLGYMFTACGMGAFAVGIFHLFTHAFFKALLFLGSGSVIHALHEQDLFKMGGLKKYMPVTFLTMFVGALAIAGIPPFAGFFSKDEILWKAFSSDHKWVWLIAWLVAGLTAFYMFRLIYLTFYGEERFGSPGHGEPAGQGHLPHESPAVMLLALRILALGCLVVGFLGTPGFTGLPNYFSDFLKPVFQYAATSELGHATEAHSLELGLAILGILMGGAGIFLAHRFYIGRSAEEITTPPKSRFYTLLFNKYYVDEIYDRVFVNGPLLGKKMASTFFWFDRNIIDGLGVNGSGWMTRAAAYISTFFDEYIVDGLVNFSAGVVDWFSYRFRRLQTGVAGRYAMVIVVGIVTFVTVYLYFVR